MNTVRTELERFLREAGDVGGEAEAQSVWASQVKRLLDVFLGPGPTNAHSAAFYEFDFAKSHAEKTGILRAILMSTASTSQLDAATAATQARGGGSSSSSPMLFASYAREDYFAVRPILDAVRETGVDIWSEVDALKPGQQFNDQIADALDNSAGLLLFLSAASTGSEYVRRELQFFSRVRRLVIPVILEQVLTLPLDIQLLIAGVQSIQIANGDPSEIERVARLIRQAVAHAKHPDHADPPERVVNRELADSLAGDARKQTSPTAAPPRSVFVVHGHDDSFLAQVEGYLTELGVDAVVLRRIGGAAQSLFQKFMQWGRETRFALVLLTSDDLGASRVQYESEGVAELSLQFRARQNVILELGFFYGHLGWENVFVLYRPPSKVFPNFERPSDLDGVLFDHADELGCWKESLRAKLEERGFVIGKPNE